MKVHLYNPDNNKTKTIKWGVSWVYLIFGGWALLFSGRWLFIGIELLFEILIAVGIGIPLCLIWHVVLFFWGNKLYAHYLVRKGWQPDGDIDRRLLGIT